MKTSPFYPLRISTLGFALTLVCLPTKLSVAKDKLEPPAAVIEGKPAGYDLQIVDGQLILPQGKAEATLPNVVDVLREQYREANIVLSPGLSKVKVTDLKLRASRLNEELEAVRVASGEKFELQEVHSVNPAIDPNTGLPQGGARSLNAGLFILRETKPPAQMQRVVEAFNIGPYLEWQRHQPKAAGVSGQAEASRQEEDSSLAEIETIISDTLARFSEDGATPDLSFQYHHGATLLVVIGTQESVEIARKIVNALPGMSAVAEESRRQSGLESGRYLSPAQRAADEAFRARYGLTRRADPTGQPGAPPVPDSDAKK